MLYGNVHLQHVLAHVERRLDLAGSSLVTAQPVRLATPTLMALATCSIVRPAGTDSGSGSASVVGVGAAHEQEGERNEQQCEADENEPCRDPP